MNSYTRLGRAVGLIVTLLCITSVATAAENAAPAPTFQRGVNICHWLSQCFDWPYAGDWFGEKDVQWIAAHGFDHIRFPIDARLWLKPDGSLDPAKIKPFENAIQWSRRQHLGIILDVHFLPGADFNDGGDGRAFVDPKIQDQAVGIWREIAKRFAHEPADVRFEIINEPVAPENKQLNVLNRLVLEAIRESNPTRIVYLTSNRWSIIGTIDDVELPDDPNIAFTFHFYEPIVFTHQNAPWVFTKTGAPAVKFPGVVPDVTPYGKPGDAVASSAGRTLSVAKDIDEPFAKMAAWAEKHAKGREILLGEFGVYRAADDASTKAWLHAVLDACKRHGFAWNLWGYRSGEFGVVDWDGRETRILGDLAPYLRPGR
ncbi:MAG TPA: cellulase family glycosylhydrolase [Lacunisphaera sp.]|nr:cellulase family glycosylhydrolase [Lacunisphaera sp.]